MARSRDSARISTSFNTKERLIDAAEALFAELGIAQTSLRDITQKALANLASVNYHFNSKEGLLQAVIERRFLPVNNERMRLLDQAEMAAPNRIPSLESVVYAIVAPPTRLFSHHPNFMRLLGRLHSEVNSELRDACLTARMGELAQRLKGMLVKILPDVPEEELFWRVHFLFGAMVHTWMCHQDLAVLSGGVACVQAEEEIMISRLVAHGVAVLGAPVPHLVGHSSNSSVA